MTSKERLAGRSQVGKLWDFLELRRGVLDRDGGHGGICQGHECGATTRSGAPYNLVGCYGSRHKRQLHP